MDLVNSAYPKEFEYHVNKLQGFERQTWKLMPMNETSAVPGAVIEVVLPSSPIIDMNSFTMAFQGLPSAASSGIVDFPKNIETIFDRIDILVNGQPVSLGCSRYNQLFNLVADMSMGVDCTTRRGVVNGNGGITGIALPTANPTTGTQYYVQNWLNFLGSVKPTMLNTDILGEIRIRMYLADASTILIQWKGTTACSYSLSNIYFLVDTVQLDPGYKRIHQEFLNRGGTYEIPFTHWQSWQSTANSTNTTTTIALNTVCLNKVFGCLTLSTGSTATNIDLYDVQSHRHRHILRVWVMER